jgi:hypothetical protein
MAKKKEVPAELTPEEQALRVALTKARGMKVVDLIELYIGLRDAVEEEQRKFKERIAKAVAHMEMAEQVINEKMLEIGTDSASSSTGTAFRTTTTRCGVKDWDALLGFIKESEGWEFLNHAVNKSAVDEYMKENGGHLPPGVKWDAIQVLQIRKK